MNIGQAPAQGGHIAETSGVGPADDQDTTALAYLPGFGNQHVTEAIPGALPEGRNSSQRAPLGLYAKQISGTAFTAPRHANRRTWVYRIRPSAKHPRYRRVDAGTLLAGPIPNPAPEPNRLRWDPFPLPEGPKTFVESLFTIGGTGDVRSQDGVAIHMYLATRSMDREYFVNSDGEMLIVPESGRLRVPTELGVLEAGRGEIVVIPRGIRFKVELPDGAARGYILENYGQLLPLPELGPIGANGLANHRDFLAPVAPSRTARRRSCSTRSSSATCGPRTTTTPRSTSSAGTGTTRPTSTTCAGSW